MNRTKHLWAAALALVMLFSLCAVPALAAEGERSVDVVYFEDGSYLTTELVVYASPAARASNTVSGQKTSTYTSASGANQWSLTVYGDFSYNYSTATATSASYGYQILASAWSLDSASAYCSGNKAIAEGTFTGGIFVSQSAAVTLSCSASGVLS